MRRKLMALCAVVMLTLGAWTPRAALAAMHAGGETAQATPAPSGSAATAPEDRTTTFQATTGGTEMRDGGKLMVAAYAILWVIVVSYLGLLWSWQRKLQARILGLEKAIDRAVAKKG